VGEIELKIFVLLTKGSILLPLRQQVQAVEFMASFCGGKMLPSSA
jgi:hypothetical protein